MNFDAGEIPVEVIALISRLQQSTGPESSSFVWDRNISLPNNLRLPHNLGDLSPAVSRLNVNDFQLVGACLLFDEL